MYNRNPHHIRSFMPVYIEKCIQYGVLSIQTETEIPKVFLISFSHGRSILFTLVIWVVSVPVIIYSSMVWTDNASQISP